LFLLSLCCFAPLILRPATSSLFPYTTLFRSPGFEVLLARGKLFPNFLNQVVFPVQNAGQQGGRWSSRWIDERQRRQRRPPASLLDRKSTRLNSSHGSISYAVFCLKKKKKKQT